MQFGVSGTPAIVLSNGYVVPGYQGPKEMKEFLDAHQKQVSGNNPRRREAVEPIDLPDDLPPLLKRLYASRGVRRAEDLERSVKGCCPAAAERHRKSH